MIELSTFAAALAAGFFGSAHCLGMCAGISGLYGVQLQIRSIMQRGLLGLVYNGGRLATYCIFGIIVGFAGQLFFEATQVNHWAKIMRGLAGVMIILVGLSILFRQTWLGFVEKMGYRLWQRMAPLTKWILPLTSTPRIFALGLLWGFLPCGLLYSALLIASLSGGAINGGLTMLAFGLGTLPAMMLTGMSAQTLHVLIQKKSIRWAASLVLIALGTLTMAQPVSEWLSPTEVDHSQHLMHH